MRFEDKLKIYYLIMEQIIPNYRMIQNKRSNSKWQISPWQQQTQKILEQTDRPQPHQTIVRIKNIKSVKNTKQKTESSIRKQVNRSLFQEPRHSHEYMVVKQRQFRASYKPFSQKEDVIFTNVNIQLSEYQRKDRKNNLQKQNDPRIRNISEKRAVQLESLSVRKKLVKINFGKYMPLLPKIQLCWMKQ